MAPPARVVSLLPAATEIVYGLGAGATLVGASHECDHPPAALKLPRVSRPRVDPNAPSGELDRQVKALKAKGQSLYEVDADLLARLKPDLILTQVQCEVCAVTPEDLEAGLRKLKHKPRVLALDAQSLEGVLNDIRLVGEALGRSEEAKLLLFRQWRLTKEIRQRVRGLAPPRVAVLDWIDPLMFAGNWIPELCAIAGASYGLVPAGKPSRWGAWEELEEYEPDVILAAPCGRDPSTTTRELAAVLKAGAPGDLRAVDAGRVWVADGHEFFNRPGPRLIYSAALMARAFHPEAVPALPESLEKHLVPWTPNGSGKANPH
ncbi:MAG: ABC transporter substrate-binding protein [Euryarchaeota archaeon]|nr:ABC transporter substrate-binding protein [Euryarchaeota archaeon]